MFSPFLKKSLNLLHKVVSFLTDTLIPTPLFSLVFVLMLFGKNQKLNRFFLYFVLKKQFYLVIPQSNILHRSCTKVSKGLGWCIFTKVAPSTTLPEWLDVQKVGLLILLNNLENLTLPYSFAMILNKCDFHVKKNLNLLASILEQ